MKIIGVIAWLLFTTVSADYILFSEDTFNCSGKSDGVYAVGPCQKAFWMCVNGVSKTMACPEGTFYSVDANQCDYKENITACFQ